MPRIRDVVALIEAFETVQFKRVISMIPSRNLKLTINPKNTEKLPSTSTKPTAGKLLLNPDRLNFSSRGAGRRKVWQGRHILPPRRRHCWHRPVERLRQDVHRQEDNQRAEGVRGSI